MFWCVGVLYIQVSFSSRLCDSASSALLHLRVSAARRRVLSALYSSRVCVFACVACHCVRVQMVARVRRRFVGALSARCREGEIAGGRRCREEKTRFQLRYVT